SRRWPAAGCKAARRRRPGQANPTPRPARGAAPQEAKRRTIPGAAVRPDHAHGGVPGREAGIVRRKSLSRKPPSGKLKEEGEQRPGLAARKTAARLLSAIIDAH